jgi:putative transcriptional regulator|tara:strand:- start:6264 stop:6575 length:312 start_codon:yes stop_codon:yes gene_type:complete
MKNNIKKLRNEMKISQKDLAEFLSVSRQTINAIETGKFDPSLKLTIKITRFFKKNLEEIFIMSVRDAIAAMDNNPSLKISENFDKNLQNKIKAYDKTNKEEKR